MCQAFDLVIFVAFNRLAMRIILFSLFFLYSCAVFGQQIRKTVHAVRTTATFDIDGNVLEEAWKSGAQVSGLVEMRPTFNKPEETSSRSEFFILYDDNAVYVAGILFESDRSNISTELIGRDNVGANDFVGVIFDTYQDRINGLGFYVTPLGEQFDIKYSIGSEDNSWNTVYESEAKINDKGWSFEMKIPYSAIRFSGQKIQNWGLQLLRRRNKTGQQYSWNPVDPAQFGFMNQAGDLLGITDIKPPLRLSFSPYFSTYLTHNPSAPKEKWSTSVNGGMDVKYGISDAFTMDMTLIPDFGQVQSDNQVLNLSPFEVRYNEYRTFFNEGTELFNKRNLFYSRRVGGTPMHYYSVNAMLGPNDTILKNPSETKLINATKISGRTKKKLGIGFFNAITKAQHALILDKSTGEEYKMETSPLTNYNIMVLDQAMKNNSSVSVINTNVWRSGIDYDANVTSLMWDLYDKQVDWNVWGWVNHSRLSDYEQVGKTTTGNLYSLFLGKFKGRFNFEVHRHFADQYYSQRDLGFFNNNNYIEHGIWAGYKWLKPKSIYNNIYVNFNANYSEMHKPRDYQNFRINANVNGQLKNLWNLGFNGDWRPESQDFYEPRRSGKMVKLPSSWMRGMWVSTNRAKKYSASMEIYHRSSAKYRSKGTEFYVGNNYRFSNKLSAGLTSYMEFFNRNLGFAFIDKSTEQVVMGLRKRRTAENVFNVKYNFNNKMGMTFRLRHYWSQVDYNRFFTLREDGYLDDLQNVNDNPDDNVNFFNIDMNYTWQFAPGSFINVNWKTASELFNQYVQYKYYRNLQNTVEAPQVNSFSIKVIYFLDYLTIQSRTRKKN